MTKTVKGSGSGTQRKKKLSAAEKIADKNVPAQKAGCALAFSSEKEKLHRTLGRSDHHPRG